MSNIITTLTARIEEYRAENKNPCKNYGSEAAAEKAPLHAVTPASVFSCSVQAAMEAMSLPRSGAKGAPPCPLRERLHQQRSSG
jgi:hypothetical protein